MVNGSAADREPELSTPQQWRDFLRDHGALFLRTANEYQRPYLDPEQVATGWMGRAAATENSIAAAERRLGVRFPPTYRSFLLASDGWDGVGGWVSVVWPCAEIYWLRDSESGQDLIEVYTEVEQETLEKQGVAEPDEEKLSLLFGRALAVAEGEDFWLFDPTETGPNGEWPAYLFTPKYGELEQFGSFSALFHDDRRLLEQFAEMQR
ncbi:SMI1/KNR4 family protein [Nocardia carnea]|uniref:SMI1/KNR4 family protein n=1 Tax=Nocardia carnea TaxID=37328 RepID=UPI002454A80A|nr:SMI1/KNR4 family protein [Nocardia carnea]